MSRHLVLRTLAAVSVACAGTSAALAHPGDHHGMGLSELVSHLSSGWHLLMLIAAAIAGLVVARTLNQRRHAVAKRGARRPDDHS